MIKNVLKFGLLWAALWACTSNAKKEQQTPTDTLAMDTQPSAKVPVVLGDSVLLPAFTVEVLLSPKAEELLQKSKETVIVMAYLSGEPKGKVPPKYQELTNEIEGLSISNYPVELKGTERSARFSAIKVPKDLYNLLKDRDMELLINVFSGRKSSENNLLSCGIWQDKFSKIAGQTIEIKGQLIEE
jgi:hypothetical protein